MIYKYYEAIKKLLTIIKMLSVDNTFGNILLKHNDKWRGDYYLRDDLTFTVDRSLATRFYLLKSGDTTILNGDRISINSGNRTLSITDSNSLRLIDRDQSYHNTGTFLITNGTDNTDPITFETMIYLISNKDKKTALKYEWGLDLIGPQDNNIIPGTVTGAVNYKPRGKPNLINGSYGDICDTYINTFEFLLEKADGPITNLDSTQTNNSSSKHITVNKNEFFDSYKGALMIFLLMIILILCALVNR
jgi:hypothetical protein